MKIHSVDQGAEHMLILSSDGKPFEYNYSIEHERLQCYSFFQEKTIIQITCGDYHSLALSKDADCPSLIEALDSQKVEFLACGGSHTALLTKVPHI
ncbi:PREDICTED: E3 ISG15--protein ligase HERC5-like [Myotis davidii]|uniref:E3 ISG15--protein ligase HERC5-like n=1 Tax=Myotis davidii TaxID=225400 RepID=UPI0007673D80|nr:PREDICTED: E3 ISG15--protein ligase HERC5-like [Myotis davidii]